MQMAHQPDDREAERDDEDEKDDSAFAPFFPKRSALSAGAAIVSPAFVLQRDGNIQPAAAFAGPRQEFLPLAARRLLGDARGLRDHPLELFHITAKTRFALREFFLFLVQRRSGFRRSAAHAGSLNLRGHPEKNQERQDPKNNQGQRHRETDLHPLRERPSGQSRASGRHLG